MDIKKLSLGLATFVGGAAALTAAAIAFGRREAGAVGLGAPLRTDAADGPAPAREQHRDISVAATSGEGHAAPDLAADAAPGQRAPDAFRPDMDAPMTPEEREALRPASGPSPTLVDAGTSQPS